MHYKALHPSKYLGAHDLQGKDVVLTIHSVKMDILKTERDDEEKPMVRFEETKASAAKAGKQELRLVLNRTNANTIAKMHGTEVDDWTGKQITLFPTTVQAFGEERPCIRIRPTAPVALAKEVK